MRIDKATEKGSVVDATLRLCPDVCRQHAWQMFERVQNRDNADVGNQLYESGQVLIPIADRASYMQFHERGRITSLSNAKTAVTIFWLLSARVARVYRRQSAK